LASVLRKPVEQVCDFAEGFRWFDTAAEIRLIAIHNSDDAYQLFPTVKAIFSFEINQ